MKLFIDTADLNEIKKASAWGVLDGATTNPTLVAKAGLSMHEAYDQIAELVNGPISVEVVGTAFEDILKEGRDIASWGKNVVVKVPMIPDGVQAISIFTEEEIKTNCTLIFSANQALLAAKAGATFVSPFVGRIDDGGQDGMNVIEQIVAIYQNFGFNSQILAASLRHPMHVVHAALAGADIATLPFKLFEQLFQHPLTDIGLKRFLDDWSNAESLRQDTKKN